MTLCPPLSSTVEQTFNMPEDEDEDICVGDFDEFMVRHIRFLAEHAGLNNPGLHALQGEDDEIDIIDDGSGQDAETNRFDQIIGALEGAGGLGG